MSTSRWRVIVCAIVAALTLPLLLGNVARAVDPVPLAPNTTKANGNGNGNGNGSNGSGNGNGAQNPPVATAPQTTARAQQPVATDQRQQPIATGQATTRSGAAVAPGMGTTIIANVSPSTAYPGAILDVAGTVMSKGTPVDQVAVNISLDLGGGTAMAVTDQAGSFSASVQVPTGTTSLPAQLVVTVTYDGDGRYPAGLLTITVPFSPTAVAVQASASNTPSVQPSSTAPSKSASAVSAASREVASGSAALALAIGAVGVLAMLALGVAAYFAYGRHRLQPGERRGFGSDFGR